MLTEGEQMIMDAIRKLQKDVSHIKKMKAGFIEPKGVKEKEAWGGFANVQRLTGWDKEDMRRARDKDNPKIEWRYKSNGGIEYNLNSILQYTS